GGGPGGLPVRTGCGAAGLAAGSEGVRLTIFGRSATAFPLTCLDSTAGTVRLEETVPLSEEELRLLEQMERALVADDPKLASTMRGTRMRRRARHHLALGILVFLVGVV